jgi:hypothetical protein
MGFDSRLFDLLVRLHEREAERCGAVFWNFGHVTAHDGDGVYSIMSKTDKGFLDSDINNGLV